MRGCKTFSNFFLKICYIADKLISMDNKKDTGHPDRDEIDINEDYV
jgi:hypothetical protein